MIKVSLVKSWIYLHWVLTVPCAQNFQVSLLLCWSAPVGTDAADDGRAGLWVLLYKLGFVTSINFVKYNLNISQNVISEATACILQEHLFIQTAVPLNCNVIFKLRGYTGLPPLASVKLYWFTSIVNKITDFITSS